MVVFGDLGGWLFGDGVVVFWAGKKRRGGGVFGFVWWMWDWGVSVEGVWCVFGKFADRGWGAGDFSSGGSGVGAVAGCGVFCDSDDAFDL